MSVNAFINSFRVRLEIPIRRVPDSESPRGKSGYLLQDRGCLFLGVVVCFPWAHLSVGIVKMQHVMAFVTGTSVCPEGMQRKPFLMVSVTVSVISMYANDVEGKPWEST